MSGKKREASTERATRHDSPSLVMKHVSQTEQEQGTTLKALANAQEQLELCVCFPLSTSVLPAQMETSIPDESFFNDAPIVPTTPQLNHVLCTHLKHLLPRTAPLSVLLLHVSQLEQPMLTLDGEHTQQRRRYHVSQHVLTQILNNVQRTIRNRDQLLVEEGVGAAMLFPSVDEQGIENIVERIYRSICLLQAETIVPPLRRVTDIVLGCGTYTRQDSFQQDKEQAIEELLTHTGRIARRLLLRPALTTSLWETMPHATPLTLAASSLQNTVEQDGLDNTPADVQEYQLDEHQGKRHITLTPSPRRQSVQRGEASKIAHLNTPTYPTLPMQQPTSSIPFLHLPTKLSPRLKHLIPYSLACQLRCAPVGRDHHTLTVAMADPSDDNALQRLQESTGMTIFPVSCEDEALDVLLAERW